MIRVYLTCEEVEIKTDPAWQRKAYALVTDRGDHVASLFFDCAEVEVKPDADGEFFDLIGGDNSVSVSFRDEPRFTGNAFRMVEPDPVETEEEEDGPVESPYVLPMTAAERQR